MRRCRQRLLIGTPACRTLLLKIELAPPRYPILCEFVGIDAGDSVLRDLYRRYALAVEYYAMVAELKSRMRRHTTRTPHPTQSRVLHALLGLMSEASDARRMGKRFVRC